MTNKMKAVIWTAYGSTDVLKIQEVEKPIPKDDEILIKTHATTVNAGDCEMRDFKITPLFWIPVRFMFGLFKPKLKIMGQEFSGEVVEAGKEVKRFKVGDKIFGATDMRMGAYAQYVCLPSRFPIAQIPSNMDFEEATTIPVGGFNALYFLRMAKIQQGEKVLVNGAGGSIGTMGVQMAKALGAEVTAVDSADKLKMLQSIGADHVIDFRKEDYTKNGIQYDVIFDIADKSPFGDSIRSLKPGGRFVLASPSLTRMIRGLWVKWTSNKKVLTGLAHYKSKDLEHIKGQIESGVLKAVIDKTYPLEKIRAAHEYVEAGKKVGNLVISVNHEN